MSLDLDAALRVFFASAPQTKRLVQTLQISHSAMPQVFYFWREVGDGSVRLETGAEVSMRSVNFTAKLAGQGGTLDQQFEISLDIVDHEDEFQEAMDAVPIDTTEKAQVIYREYLSDDLTTVQAMAKLQLETVSFKPGTATLSATSPRLNVTRTGEVYAPKDIPMLRALI